MNKFNQEEFNKFIEENNVYGFFEKPITLKSGRQSQFYANWRNVVEDTWLTERLAEYVIAFAEDAGIQVNTFYGVPEGATKLGIITQYKHAKQSPSYDKGTHVLSMGRAKPKEHGDPKDKYFVGMPRGKVIVLEDVTTTGGSLITTLDGLVEAGIKVAAVFSLTNRMEKRDDGLSVKQALEQRGYKFYSMSTATEVLPLVYKKLKPGKEIGAAIEKEFQQYGVEPIRLG